MTACEREYFMCKTVPARLSTCRNVNYPAFFVEHCGNISARLRQERNVVSARTFAEVGAPI